MEQHSHYIEDSQLKGLITKALLRSPDFKEACANIVVENIRKGLNDRRLLYEIELWTKFVERSTTWERKYRDRMIEVLGQLGSEVYANMKRYGKFHVAKKEDLSDWIPLKGRWESVLHRESMILNQAIVEDYGKQAMAELNDYYEVSKEKRVKTAMAELPFYNPVTGEERWFDANNPNVVARLQQRSIKFAKEVVGTTEQQIRGILAEGIGQGEGMRELRNRIRSYFEGDSIRNRAEMIARSETIWASNAGAVSAYKQSGVVEGKEWIVADDERTCDYCRSMGVQYGKGRAVALDRPFLNKGDYVFAGARAPQSIPGVAGFLPNCKGYGDGITKGTRSCLTPFDVARSKRAKEAYTACTKEMTDKGVQFERKLAKKLGLTWLKNNEHWDCLKGGTIADYYARSKKVTDVVECKRLMVRQADRITCKNIPKRNAEAAEFGKHIKKHYVIFDDRPGMGGQLYYADKLGDFRFGTKGKPPRNLKKVTMEDIDGFINPEKKRRRRYFHLEVVK